MKQIILLTYLCFLPYHFLYAQGLTEGGPDPYGYRFKSSANAAHGITPNWVDVTTLSPAHIDITNKFDDDNFFGPINFSFPFPYYWYSHNELYVQSNGAISFKPELLAAGFAAIPFVAGATDDFLAVHMTDLTLNKSSSNNGKVYFWTDFKDSVVVSWIDVPYFGAPSPGSGCTFQVILEANGTITYQYLKSQGVVNSNGCTSGCFVVGIENINGKVGLQHSRISTGPSPFSTYTATTPLAIKWFRPDSSTYKIKDAQVEWNNVPGNGGIFVSKGTSPKSMRTKIVNQGLEDLPPKQVRASVYINNTNTLYGTQTNTLCDTIPVGEDTVLVVPKTIPSDSVSKYRFQTDFIWPNVPSGTGDEIQTNNSLSQLICVVDTTTALIDLDYTDGTDENVLHFLLVSPPFNAGLGTYIVPPFFPCKIKTLNAILYDSQAGTGPPVGPVQFVLYDDDGRNLLGEQDGSPGTLLFDTILAAGVGGWNRIPVPGDLQINSGGVYIGVLQGSDGVGIGIDTDVKTLSYQSFEVIGGSFTPYRSRKAHDPIIGMSIAKGDIAQILDLKMEEVVTPKDNDVITDSVEVKVIIRNIGNQPISGPFDVAYRANTRAEVLETIPAAVTIPVGANYNYTFTTKSARPAPPKTQYELFCARVFIANDFNLLNDTLCYENQLVGIDSQSEGLISVSPNPSSGWFTLEMNNLPGEIDMLQVYDLSGRLVADRKLGLQPSGYHSLQIGLKHLPEGIYSYKILAEKSVYTGRLVILK